MASQRRKSQLFSHFLRITATDDRDSVREGLVHISMDLESLRPYQDPPHHARRSGIHEPPYRSNPFRPEEHDTISLSDALRDPLIAQARHQTHIEDHFSPPAAPRDFSRAWTPDADDQEAFCDTLSSQSDDMPVTLLSDEETGPEDSSTQEVLDYRLRRMRLMQRRQDFESWDRAERWGGISTLHRASQSRDRERERERARDPALPEYGDPRNTALYPAASALPESRPTPAADPNVTTARFRVNRNKSSVTLKFSPAVSGRFILLKVWSAPGKGNVDVQSVVAKGFGGGRFFPSIEMR
jgi:hypothetical protein